MQEIIDGWAVPSLEVFAADLEPVALMPRRTTVMRPLSRSGRRRAASANERRVLPLALALNVRAPSRRCHAVRKCCRSACTLIAAPQRS
jgi:hypothetical protein